MKVPEPCKLSARAVAQYWLAGEALHYRTCFDATAETRLTAVIQRARNDGWQLGRPPIWQWLLVGGMAALCGHAMTFLYFMS